MLHDMIQGGGGKCMRAGSNAVIASRHPTASGLEWPHGCGRQPGGRAGHFTSKAGWNRCKPLLIHSSIKSGSVPADGQMHADRVVSALQPTWLIGLGRARTRDQPVSRRKGYPDRFRGSPPRSSVDAMPDLIVLTVPCQVVGDVTPTPCATALERAAAGPCRGLRRAYASTCMHHQLADVRSHGTLPLM